MENFIDWRAVAGSDPDRLFKTTLFRGDHLHVGLNCLEPGQVQKVHVHDGQDKFYFVVEGVGEFVVGGRTRRAGPGTAIWAPAGEPHGVANRGHEQLTLLVGMGPPPAG